jgi:uncharacterized repeat protein (TIGR03806 family)
MIFVVMLSCWLTACGGGSGGDAAPVAPAPGPAADPFGLTVKEPLAVFNLPVQGVVLGSFNLVNRFPNLSFSNAVYLAGVPGGNRLVVVQQSGLVRAFVNDPSSDATRTVLDLSARVLFSGEQGLLGLAFDPAFAQNRYVYVHYSVSGPARSIISRLTWDAPSDLVDPVSEKVLLEIAQPFSNHNGGMLAFGPDDYLYIAMGDGGGSGDPRNNAQDPSKLLGSMLRIDVHPNDPADPYDIPLDNPTFSQSNARPETYAIGLRNPFRFSFDRQTGALWLGDVGQGAIEEIDIINAGGNYGWRVFEGTQAFDGSLNTLPNSAFTPPVFEYDHSQGVAVIGGYVYRGNALPSLQGRYLYSDFGSGTVWALEYDGANVLASDVIATASSPTSFGEDNPGEVYIVSRNAGIFGLEAGAGGGGSIPDQLSETGLFTDLANLIPASGLIEYQLNHPFWSDDALKRRWVGIPDGAQVQFAATGPWQFPQGTVVVKHFELELTPGEPGSRRRLETRLLINTSGGWQGFTYRWNAQGTDAELLTGRETEIITVNLPGGGTRDQFYDYPSRTDCLGCHTEAAGRTLGLKTRQINRDFDYANATDNQLRSWNHIALFDTDIGAADRYERFANIVDPQALGLVDGVTLARTYLDVNCAQCHRPGGPTPVELDLRFDTAVTAMNALDVVPAAGDLAIANARIIAPGEKERSVLWQRMRSLDGQRMPPLGSQLVDEFGVSVVGVWIDGL